MVSTTWMTLAPGWRWTFRITAGVRVGPGAELGVLGAVDDGGDVGQPHRRAVAIGDDQLAVVVAGW